MSDLAIDIRKVVKRFDEHVAVRDLSLQVPRGSVYGLLGPNGAGKTTTIRMILNIMLPTRDDLALRPPEHRPGVLDRVGYLPEERGLYKKMQVRARAAVPRRAQGRARREADRRIDEWLERFGLVTPREELGRRRRSTSCRAACSRRCSSSARCCTIPIS